MAVLKEVLTKRGLKDVRTYINSGNVLFRSENQKISELTTLVEAAIEEEFGFSVAVILRDEPSFLALLEVLPTRWQNNEVMKADVMFLWEEADTPEVVRQCGSKPEIDEVIYHPGAILWRVDRAHQARSGMQDLVGTKLYRQMTIRNVNTVRKLAELLRS